MIQHHSARLIARIFSHIRARSGSWRLSVMCLLMSAMVAVLSSPVMAQSEALRPPKTSDSPSGPKYVIYLVGVLLTAAVVFAATFKSKRSHQD